MHSIIKLFLALVFLLPTLCFSAVNTTIQGNTTLSAISVGTNPVGVTNLTWYADFTDGYNDANADFSKVTRTANIIALRNATNIATYYDVNGFVANLSTANTSRITEGVFTENGFLRVKGLWIEGTLQNIVYPSELINHAYWVKEGTEAETNSILCPNNITSTAVTIKATADNGKVYQKTTVGAGRRQFSVWAKGINGTSQVNLSIDNATTCRTWNLSQTEFKKIYVEGSPTNPVSTMQLLHAGDEVAFWGMMTNGAPFFGSYVPTQAAASISKVAETYSYAGASTVLPAQNSTIIIDYFALDEIANAQRYLFDTDADAVSMNITATGLFKGYPNRTGNSTLTVASFASISRNQNLSVAFVRYGAADATNCGMYVNGLFQNISVTDYAVPTIGANMYLGSTSAGASNMYGIVKHVAIFDAALTNDQINASLSSMRTGAWSNYFNNVTPKVLTLGDSITQGTGAEDGAYYGSGYRFYLQDRLGATSYAFVGHNLNPSSYNTTNDIYSLRNSGVSGERSDQLLNRTTTHLNNYMGGITDNQSIVLLHIGTNDITSGVTNTTIVNNTMAIVNMTDTFNPNIKVFVAAIVPRNDSAANDLKTTDYNTLLNASVQARKATKTNLYWVDINGAFKANATWAPDLIPTGGSWLDIHPNDAGYKVMAETWANAINATK